LPHCSWAYAACVAIVTVVGTQYSQARGVRLLQRFSFI